MNAPILQKPSRLHAARNDPGDVADVGDDRHDRSALSANNVGLDGVGYLDAQQNSRFAVSMLERELRVAGVGVVDQQPLLVMADTLSLTFNADLVALDTADMGSENINPKADTTRVDVLLTKEPITLPTTTTTYP